MWITLEIQLTLLLCFIMHRGGCFVSAVLWCYSMVLYSMKANSMFSLLMSEGASGNYIGIFDVVMID